MCYIDEERDPHRHLPVGAFLQTPQLGVRVAPGLALQDVSRFVFPLQVLGACGSVNFGTICGTTMCDQTPNTPEARWCRGASNLSRAGVKGLKVRVTDSHRTRSWTLLFLYKNSPSTSRVALQKKLRPSSLSVAFN
uniref:Uncharacterized protein n=1 Tax=Piliocolobus tephrosceles TaxID=591936 RepID=A0A8C9IG58_9PRIM